MHSISAATYDVIVVGAGAGGMSAALFAAIEGQESACSSSARSISAAPAPCRPQRVDSKFHAQCQGVARRQRREGRKVPGRRRRQSLECRHARGLPREWPRSGRDARSATRKSNSVPSQRIPTTSRTSKARHCAAAPWSHCRSTAARSVDNVIYDSPADPRVHDFRWHDGRSHRHRPSAQYDKSIASAWHATKIIARYGLDRFAAKRGTRLVMGNAFIGRLLKSLLDREVDIITADTRASIHHRTPMASQVCCSKAMG